MRRSIAGLLAALLLAPLATRAAPTPRAGSDRETRDHALRLIEEGRRTFRYDTFGDEAFWSGALRLHEAIAGAAGGGVGDGVSPRTALAVGLKVDVEALPKALVRQLKAGAVDLDDPATTVALLGLDAVVGVRGTVGAEGRLESVGITCALCHSVVDDVLAPGIGRRLDGWANRDLDVGTIISLSPDLSPISSLLGVDDATLRAVLAGWGPGKFDAGVLIDGKALRPDGAAAATLIPPAFGLAGVNLHTFTGWGSVPYWNAFVATLEMGGSGTFVDARLADPVQFPVAVRRGAFDVRPAVDLVTPKLPALHFYQLSLPPPTPPPGSFDPAAARRGEALFTGRARCAGCHVPPIYTEPGWNLHTAAEIGIDDFQASRSPEGRYRTTPLRGLWSHQKGGFYHDGRFADLPAVVRHYDATFGLGLTEEEVADLVDYLRSL